MPSRGSQGEAIVACVTPWGRSAVALLRLSGEGLASILEQVCGLRRGLPAARRASLVGLRDADGVFDQGLLLWMPAPRSYTGEDCAELSCHGNPLLAERLLSACLTAGCRLAQPGEFTRRAFLNGRMDLLRAEAVLQAIEARSLAGLEVARQGLSGRLGAWAEDLRRRLLDCAAQLEARLDFPYALEEEEQVASGDAELLSALDQLGRQLRDAADSFESGRVRVHGATVALVGPVNAGKSSLFNALLGRRRALVSDTPGTTRDVLEAHTRIGGAAVTLLDSAGENLQAAGLERDGLDLRDELLADADLLVVVLPAHRPELPESRAILERSAGRRRVLVGNHADRAGAVTQLHGQRLLPTCALDDTGLQSLKAAIQDELLGEEPGGAAVVIASQRQRDLLLALSRQVGRALDAARGEAGVAVAAEELMAGLQLLDDLRGSGAREQVLDRLFARFCIGK